MGRGRQISEVSVSLPTSSLNEVRFSGRLANFAHVWGRITSDPEVLSAVRGYKIPFSSPPKMRPFLNEPVFTPSVAAHCDAEIQRLLDKDAIAQVEPSEDQFLSFFFLIEKPSGGMRFILNLKELNFYISPPHFKLEDWRTVVRLMLPGSQMASLDLEDAYLLVAIHLDHRKFLRFQWRGNTFQFSALPFGLATAPYIFTKLLRPVVASLRAQGYESVLYLDDFLLLAPSKAVCRLNAQAHINLLSSLGFAINFQKSELEPSHERKYLGFVFNSVQQSVAIPEQRRRNLYALVSSLSRNSHCSIQVLASMIGSLVSICPAVQYGLLYTKSFERAKYLALKRFANNFSAIMKLPSSLNEDFRWWLTILSNPHQKNCIRTSNYSLEIFSDASLTGWGAACFTNSTHGWWSEEERLLHINILELKAAFYALKSFAATCRDCNILLRLDNTTALSYINRFGSVRFPLLSSIAKDIWQWCEERNIFLFASHIPSSENVTADSESRQLDTNTEWSLSKSAFRAVFRRFGPFEIDLFASALNAKCDTYISWLPDPGSFAVDAFTLSWEGLFFYAFPPFILVTRVLRKIIDDRAEGVVVVPWWPSQSWFPLFQRMLIEEPLILSPSNNLLSAPLRSQHPAASSLSLAAGKLSGRLSLHD